MIHHPPDMPQSLSAVYIYLVFSTKDRRPFLRDKPTRERNSNSSAVNPQQHFHV
jgi:hypothetical protein